MRIAVFTTNNPSMYSGGRYLSLVLAEALAISNDVFYVTNNIPIFYDDFINYDQHKSVNLCLTPDFSQDVPAGDFDVVVLIPSSTKDPTFYLKVRLFCAERNARLVLFNFESPNWFNSLSFEKRDEKYWDHWKCCCEDGALVLSMAEEGTMYAKEYYTNYPDRTLFETWYPVINSLEANRAPEGQRSKRIIIITRASDSHKGAQDFFDFLSKDFSGYTFVFLIGTKHVDSNFSSKLQVLAEKYRFSIEFKHQLNDYDKFVEIKNSQLMLFPSYFEGYGYPPVEAVYCNTPCLAYDLPVLRETCGDSLFYVDRGDIQALREKALDILAEDKTDFTHTNQSVAARVDFYLGAKVLNDIFTRFVASKPVVPNASNVVTLRKKIEGTCKSQHLPQPFRVTNFLNRLKYFFSDKSFLCGVGKVECIDKTLIIKGFCLFRSKIDCVELCHDGSVLESVQCNVYRNDVYKKYPQYNELNSGFSLAVNLPESVSEESSTFELNFFASSRQLVGTKIIKCS